MITCFLKGGLGNQLFEIFTTISYAIKSNQNFSFLYSRTLNGSPERPTYWNSFLLCLKMFTVHKLPENMHIMSEENFNYKELPINTSKNIILDGYFQSYKYFEYYFENICKLIQLDKQKTMIQQKHLYNYKNMISMHFRIGDYKHKQNYHPVMNLQFYKNSIQHIINIIDKLDLKFLYFCEDEDVEEVSDMVEQLQHSFEKCKFISANSNSNIKTNIEDWEQMLMMSLCQHNIIPNSTFSWWGAYFNSNTEKIVCYPDVWFGPAVSKRIVDDLFPESWTKISCH